MLANSTSMKGMFVLLFPAHFMHLFSRNKLFNSNVLHPDPDHSHQVLISCVLAVKKTNTLGHYSRKSSPKQAWDKQMPNWDCLGVCVNQTLVRLSLNQSKVMKVSDKSANKTGTQRLYMVKLTRAAGTKGQIWRWQNSNQWETIESWESLEKKHKLRPRKMENSGREIVKSSKFVILPPFRDSERRPKAFLSK